MKRQSFRNFWLISILTLLASAWFLFDRAQNELMLAEYADANLLELKRERRNMETLAQDLARLDKLTIDSKSATRLGILRHLDLEDKDYDFKLGSSQDVQVGAAILTIRGFDLKANLPYAEALQVIDVLQANPKVVLYEYALTGVNEGEMLYGDMVKLSTRGALYGLQKNAE